MVNAYSRAFGLTSDTCLLRQLSKVPIKETCNQSPPFSASINFELYKNKKSGLYFVTVKYQESNVNICDLKNPSDPCPFALFEQKFSQKLFNTLSEEEYCKKVSQKKEGQQSSLLWAIGGAFFTSALLCYVFVGCGGKKNKTSYIEL